MTTMIYYTATSLDGFLADPADSLAWLFAQDHQEPDDPTLHYATLEHRTGALIMGATTYLWIRHQVINGTLPGGPDGESAPDRWPYAVPTWVFTHRDLPTAPDADVRFVADDVASVHPQIVGSAAGKDLWLVGGGDLAGQYADAGLLEEILVSIAPVTLGAGRPLLPRRLQLRTRQVVQAGAFACVRYGVDGVRPGTDWTS